MDAKKTYFFAGTYGVGKSTVCRTISQLTGIPEFSASAIISSINGELYGSNKVVNDKQRNQSVLAKGVEEILQKEKEIILSGHFCIFDKNDNVEYIPEQVYTQLHIDKIILLEADTEKVISHLSERDDKQYSTKSIYLLQKSERTRARLTAIAIGKPILIHKMRFDESDVQLIVEVINRL
jgi:adenylate kinase